MTLYIYSNDHHYIGLLSDPYVCQWVQEFKLSASMGGARKITTEILDMCMEHINKIINMKLDSDHRPASHSDKLYYNAKYPNRFFPNSVQGIVAHDKATVEELYHHRNIIINDPYPLFTPHPKGFGWS